jgi:hypothetical protein
MNAPEDPICDPWKIMFQSPDVKEPDWPVVSMMLTSVKLDVP